MSVDEQTTDLVAGFEVRVEPAREVVRVRAIGELDLATGPELRDRVLELVAAGFNHVVIDLRGLSFIDASGVGLLLWFTAQAQTAGWRLSLIPGRDQIQRVLTLTGAVDRLAFCGTGISGQWPPTRVNGPLTRDERRPLVSLAFEGVSMSPDQRISQLHRDQAMPWRDRVDAIPEPGTDSA